MDILDLAIQDTYLPMIQFLLQEDHTLINHVVYDGHTVRYHLHLIISQGEQQPHTFIPYTLFEFVLKLSGVVLLHRILYLLDYSYLMI